MSRITVPHPPQAEMIRICFFFFQAEDGIRDVAVTGVQTCALPICSNVSNINCQLRLQNRPKGLLAPGDLQLIESPVPEIRDGQALARVKYLSIDPTMRLWMAADTYLPAVGVGEVMRAIGFAEIVESRHPDYKKGHRSEERRV